MANVSMATVGLIAAILIVMGLAVSSLTLFQKVNAVNDEKLSKAQEKYSEHYSKAESKGHDDDSDSSGGGIDDLGDSGGDSSGGDSDSGGAEVSDEE
jgi:hypothetical protein